MTPARRHWLLALAAAVVLHVGIAVAVLSQAPRSGAQSAGASGLEVSLGAAGGAPGSVEVEAPGTAEADQAAEPPTEAPPEPVQAEPVKPAEPGRVQAEPSPVEPEVAQPQPVEVAEASGGAASQAVLALAESPAEPPGEPPPEPPAAPVEAPVEAPEPEVTEAEMPEPEPQSEPGPEPPPKTGEAREAESAQQANRETVEAAEDVPERDTATASAVGSGNDGGTQGSQEQASGDESAAGGAPGARADYIAALRAWLERHKEYPRRARLRRQEGVAVLRFVVARDGEVLEYALDESSGHSVLDREVEAMIQRASPLPEMPGDMGRGRLELVIPVQFSLR